MKYKLKITLILCIILMITPVLAYAAETSPSSAETKSYAIGDSPISMEVSYGYDNTAKGGRYIPIRAELKNSSLDGFTGRLQILSMESDYDVYQYDYPISIDGDSAMVKSVDIPLGNRVDQLFLTVLDSNGVTVANKRVKLNVNLDVSELFIGVLSDTPEKLQYLNGVGINYSMLRTKTFNLTPETFPTDEIGLNLVDVILISNFRIRDLSERQTQVLMEWVRNGGIMIMGTGSRVDDTLGRFAPELLDESYDNPSMMEVNLGIEYSTTSPSDSYITIPCVNISLHGGNVIFSDDQLPLLSSVTREKGMIAVAAYDFVDIARFCQENPSYIDKMFTSLLGEDKINRLAESVYSGNSNQYWSVRSMINAGKVDQLPNVPLYVMEILIYIILVGPGLYIFLKQRNLRQYYRTGLILLSALFTVIIYMMGSKTRFTDTFYTYARFLEASEDTISENTYLNLRVPYNKPYTADIDPEYSIRPITRSYYYEMMNAVPKFTGTEDYKIAIGHDEEKTSLSVQNVVAFEPKYFQLSKSEENKNHMGFTGEVRQFDGKITGYIINNFGHTVDNAAVLLYGQMIQLGEMKPGERKNLDDLLVVHYPLNHSYIVSEVITGSDQFKKADIDNEDYMKAWERTRLLIYYMDNYMTSYTSEARVIGFCEDWPEDGMVMNESYTHNGLTMVSSTLTVNPYQGKTIYRNALMKTPTHVSGQYDSKGNSIYGVDPAVLEYSFGNDIDIEKIEFADMSEIFVKNEKYTYVTPFSGNMYFYNYDTGNYDMMKYEKKEYTRQQLKPYLSPGNTMNIKFIYDNKNEYGWDIILPIIYVTGEER